MRQQLPQFLWRDNSNDLQYAGIDSIGPENLAVTAFPLAQGERVTERDDNPLALPRRWPFMNFLRFIYEIIRELG